MTPLIDYTISSYDYNHYNRIDINLPSPPSRRVSMIVTSLTTKCSIVVIEMMIIYKLMARSMFSIICTQI